MFLLLGATTYVGQAFARALRRRKDAFIPLSRSAFDYTQFEFLLDYVRKVKPELLINAAGSPETPGRDVPESDRMEVLQTNTLLPQTIAKVCHVTNTPWGHVSSGSIYTGGKVLENGSSRVEYSLNTPATRRLFLESPQSFAGFSELDEPNFSFKAAPCTFYSGTKALAEEALDHGQNFVWRLRLPFNEQEDPANFLSQLLGSMANTYSPSNHSGKSERKGDLAGTDRLDILHNGINSLSQVDECVMACLELWDRHAPYGIYNVVNPGAVSTQQLVQKIQNVLKPVRKLHLLVYEAKEDEANSSSPRSDCILDVSKLLKVGIKLRPIKEAIDGALQHWQNLKHGNYAVGKHAGNQL
jgi:dTDP-4-dehydrorhamnose reductase